MLEVILRILKDYIYYENKIKYFILIFFSLIIFGVGILEPFFMKDLISLVEEFLKNGTYSYNSFLLIFIYWGLFIVFITISKGVIGYGINQLMLISYNRIYINNASKIMKMGYGDFLNKKQGEIYKVFDRGMEWGFFFSEMFIIKYLESIVSIIVIVTILFYIDYRMAFASLAMVPIMFLVGFFINSKTLKKQKEVNNIWDHAYGLFGDSIGNLPLVKTLALEKKLLSKLKEKLTNGYNLQVKVTKRWTIGDIYTGFLVMISRFLVLSLGIYFLIHGSLTFSVLFLFFSYIGYIYFPLSFLFTSLKNIQKQLTGIEKFYKLVDTLNIDLDSVKSSNITLKGDIKFENVKFGYNEGIGVLKGVNFEVKSGEKVALVGNTGAGKSTISSLLFRFWEVDEGNIYFDGLKISDISKIDLRNNIGIVMQDNSLFNMSIRDNLSYSRDGITESDIIDALKKSEANFVFDLEKGLDTIIGERGLKLSGGQKQRLNIARLFLKNPKILILDEATSSLDNKTEKLVQKALDKLMLGRTSIVIAHRLSTIQNSDNIFVLEKGNIIEEGNYDNLMNKKGKFYNLANPDNLILQ